jgi:putative membrane protein
MKAAGKIASLAGRQLLHEQKKKAGPLVHYGFGTLQGAMYGAVTGLAGVSGGFLPSIIFGAALFAVADEIALPALGLSGKPTEYPASTHLYGLASHIVYGLSTEIARRGLRAAI